MLFSGSCARIVFSLNMEGWPPWRNTYQVPETGYGSRSSKSTTLRDTGLPVIIVTHTGNKTGAVRKAPLMRVKNGNSYVLVGSQGGAPKRSGLGPQSAHQSECRASRRDRGASDADPRGQGRAGSVVEAGRRSVPAIRRVPDKDDPANTGSPRREAEGRRCTLSLHLLDHPLLRLVLLLRHAGLHRRRLLVALHFLLHSKVFHPTLVLEASACAPFPFKFFAFPSAGRSTSAIHSPQLRGSLPFFCALAEPLGALVSNAATMAASVIRTADMLTSCQRNPAPQCSISQVLNPQQVQPTPPDIPLPQHPFNPTRRHPSTEPRGNPATSKIRDAHGIQNPQPPFQNACTSLPVGLKVAMPTS